MISGKKILLVSPQAWGHIAISKHHYAEVLGSVNEVFFLQPPSSEVRRGSFRCTPSGKPGVTLIDWMPLTPSRLQRWCPMIYEKAISFDIKRLLGRLKLAPDIAWSFDCGRYPDLRAFGAPITILHAVDPIGPAIYATVGRTADVIVSVSQSILDSFNGIDTERHLIGHGVASEFQRLAEQPPPPRLQDGRSHCGYFGNLDFNFINGELIAEIAMNHPQVLFHFWGPSTPESRLRKALAGLDNCRFHGTVNKQLLASAAAGMDCFILAYDATGHWDRSNSHKLLEYFATGKVVVSTQMHAHSDTELLVMSKQPGDGDFPVLFASVLANISEHNSIDRVAARKAIALQNSYERQVSRIGDILTCLKVGAVKRG